MRESKVKEEIQKDKEYHSKNIQDLVVEIREHCERYGTKRRLEFLWVRLLGKILTNVNMKEKDNTSRLPTAEEMAEQDKARLEEEWRKELATWTANLSDKERAIKYWWEMLSNLKCDEKTFIKKVGKILHADYPTQTTIVKAPSFS